MCISTDGIEIPCAVQQCCNGKFRLLDFDVKKQIVQQGKPTPKLLGLSKKVESKKKFTRTFQVHYYTVYSWMTGCSSTNKIYCWPCLLFSNHNSVWNMKGFGDLNNLSNAIKTHVKSSQHMNATLNLSSFSKSTLHAGFDLQQRADTERHNAIVRKNRLILKRLIDTVLHLSNQELSFRGHDESEDSLNRGNYIQTLQLIAQYDNELETHLSSNAVFRGTSSHIQNDLIHAIAMVLKNAQQEEINEASFVAILLDESSDRAKHSQLSTLYRYCYRGVVKETFVGFTNVSSDRTANALFSHVKSSVESFGCSEKLVAQGYDGAAVMASHINGLQAKVREEYKNALFIHCCAHILNLVLSEISKSISDCRIFFNSLQGFAAFFSQSTKRNELLERIVNKKFPQICVVRWCFKSKLVHTVSQNRDKLIYLFGAICGSDPDIAGEFNGTDLLIAQGFLTYLNQFHFNFLLEVFSIIFTHTDKLYEILQKKGLEVNICITRLDETTNFLIRNRDNGFDNIYTALVNRMGPPTNRGNNGYQYYKALYDEIHDTILSQLNKRFQNLRSLKFTALLDHRMFASYESVNGKFPQDSAESLKQLYKDHFDHNKLRNELEVVYASESFKGKTVIEIYQYLSGELKSTFSEVHKLCDLTLTLPSTTASVERSFSALNRIMDYLRTTMTQERLSDLALLALGRELLHELKKRPDFYELVITEFLKKDRRIELHFRN